jgi:hypothetical protein
MRFDGQILDDYPSSIRHLPFPLDVHRVHIHANHSPAKQTSKLVKLDEPKQLGPQSPAFGGGHGSLVVGIDPMDKIDLLEKP